MFSKPIFQVSLICFALCQVGLARDPNAKLFSVQATATRKADRQKIANLGMAIDRVFSDSVGFLATQKEIAQLKEMGIPVKVRDLPKQEALPRGLLKPEANFPSEDGAFHTYSEVVQTMDNLALKYPKVATRFSIGKSLEKRDLPGIRLSANSNLDSLPTALFMGCHHAREHLSVEVPLKIAQYLAENFEKDARITELLKTREVYIVPMVNPDGAEYDISGVNYKYWRKNRKGNSDGTFGVDLNRNYGKGFGGEGSSSDPSSDVYHGPSAFSEPETQAVRDWVRARKKTTVLLTFHTFSELVLWPFGDTNDQVPSETDQKVFEIMGKKMASWNHYTPQKSSELYLASGDTTDWAYDELKIFAFTFELTPDSMFAGGFYPGAQAIEPTFQANIEPSLYLIEKAGNPYSVLTP